MFLIAADSYSQPVSRLTIFLIASKAVVFRAISANSIYHQSESIYLFLEFLHPFGVLLQLMLQSFELINIEFSIGNCLFITSTEGGQPKQWLLQHSYQQLIVCDCRTVINLYDPIWQQIIFLRSYNFIGNYLMSFFGVELNAQVNRLLLEIRLKLSQNKFQPNFRTIYRSFAQCDPEITGVLPSHKFEKCINENGLFFKKYEIQVLEKMYSEQNGINWFAFMGHLREPMGPLRRQLVEEIFDTIDSDHQGKVTPEKLLTFFDPGEIELFKKGLKSSEQVESDFLGLLSIPEGEISREEFIAYYDDLSINFPHNSVFIRYVSRMWNHTPRKVEEAKEEEVKAAIKALRYKLIQKSQGTKDQFLLRKLFAEFDRNQNNAIGTYELDLMMKHLQVPVAAKIVEPALEKLDKNQTGYIEYEQFKKFLFFDPWPI